MDTSLVPSTLPRWKIVLVILGIIGVALFAALNIWVYRLATGKQAPTQSQQEAAGIRPATSPARSERGGPTATAAPIPRPTGPGIYACDPSGICGIYGQKQREDWCSVTFADELCLDQCADMDKRCKN